MFSSRILVLEAFSGYEEFCAISDEGVELGVSHSGRAFKCIMPFAHFEEMFVISVHSVRIRNNGIWCRIVDVVIIRRRWDGIWSCGICNIRIGVCVVGFCNVNSNRRLMNELMIRRINHVHEAVELIYPVVEVILWFQLVSRLRFVA